MVERDVVLSTNDLAAEMVRAGAALLPMVVWAHRQTRGRGRGSHEWWSDPGSLTFTIAIDPAAHGIGQMALPGVALSTAVAVIDALEELGFREPELGIRWPNDIECGGKKLSGILPEVVEVQDGVCLLIGVGLNVTTKLEEAPREVRAMATSLAATFSRAIESELSLRLLAAILRHFESVLRRLALGDRSLPASWNGRDLLRDRAVSVDVGTHVVSGRGCGIDALGALCLDDGSAMIQLFGGSVLRWRSG
jgi:BirA family biotin operon repressor/biotin-[acetyl-CoA-carboxylase] ligase